MRLNMSNKEMMSQNTEKIQIFQQTQCEIVYRSILFILLKDFPYFLYSRLPLKSKDLFDNDGYWRSHPLSSIQYVSFHKSFQSNTLFLTPLLTLFSLALHNPYLRLVLSLACKPHCTIINCFLLFMSGERFLQNPEG